MDWYYRFLIEAVQIWKWEDLGNGLIVIAIFAQLWVAYRVLGVQGSLHRLQQKIESRDKRVEVYLRLKGKAVSQVKIALYCEVGNLSSTGIWVDHIVIQVTHFQSTGDRTSGERLYTFVEQIIPPYSSLPVELGLTMYELFSRIQENEKECTGNVNVAVTYIAHGRTQIGDLALMGVTAKESGRFDKQGERWSVTPSFEL